MKQTGMGNQKHVEPAQDHVNLVEIQFVPKTTTKHAHNSTQKTKLEN